MAQSRANGSHYALTAIGLGMLVLGIIMAVWNLVPGFGPTDKPTTHAGNSSKPDRGTGGILKSKTFSVAYVLVGAGVLLLLLSICLNIRDKKRQSEDIAHVQHQPSAEPSHQEDSQEEDEDVSSQYYVPSYEEVMNSGYSEPRDSDRSNRISVSLPSYESLTGLEESSQAPGAAGAEPSPERQSSRHSSRLSKRLKPLKVRRIKSEKLHLKDIRLNLAEGNSTAPITIEPLTPPPKYEEIQEKAPERQQIT
ncbi:transmembrane protein 51 [Athene cunicularia]|uniref:Transmembrane protein 51 n=1 Tax=Athene cunicularia TaxID=194338 RepID=A0A663LPG6_ATHCN|nr:transmembrane protein 51 [Athene cunicularia]XP_026718594.1 transmembrane protein 51 [Athene cunicularia]XP_026718595.1 transmembrane protein 51 [Athene cunicularia]XP_026718596.1 transmembrane protein 51 [Athene cunicularia]XP_026718597.1 transmembrane protein 51 [Athene cunicularia]XP_026718598.1 transmembrane protein 51 [Athene cunicularia]XP_026718599.1 transmembrane protein 51 [Athene cunicularia]